MNFLYSLSMYFEMLVPIMAFMLLVACFAFLVYLRKKSERFFQHIHTLSRDIERIADSMERTLKN